VEIFLWELNFGKQGEILEFVRNFPVTQGVITDIADNSSEELHTMQNVESNVIEVAQSANLTSLYYNHDNEAISKAVESVNGGVRLVKKSGVGYSGDDIKIKEARQGMTELGEPNLSIALSINGNDYQYSTKIFGKQHARSMAFAFSVALELGASPDEICSRMAEAGLPSGIGRIYLMGGGGFAIDESCLASPDSVSYSIKNIVELETRDELPKLAILGGMHGLGGKSLYWHEVVMSRASLLDGVFLIGDEWDGVVTEQSSLRGKWADVDAFLRDFDPASLSGSVTLVKGSPFYGLGKILTLAPRQLEAKLCN
jgi:UDP-N-acetylmuramyl pentapeptide synthase